MKILIKLSLFLVVISSNQVCLAIEQTVSKPEMKMDESKMMEHLKMRQEQMLKMDELSDRIRAETDPQKKQALKDEHLQLIKAEHMQMMTMHHTKMMNMNK
jgi:hypothetical protein